jgi:tetratricopeptide (TPR) repeat protein
MKTKLLTTIFFFIFCASIHSMGGAPPVDEKTPTDSAKETSVFDKANGEEEVVKELNEEEIYDLEQDYIKALKNKQFKAALSLIAQLPEATLNKKRKKEKKILKLYQKIEEEQEESSSTFAKEDDLEPTLAKAVKRLYREAQFAFMQEKKDLTRDILIQMIYLHRRNFKSKKLLEYGLDLKLGSYKVENMEEKYWKKSNVFFYGGNYIQSVDSLNTLSYFDRENAEIYKRLGSSYYMMGEKKEAIGAWNTALFYKPNDKELKEVISKTEKLLKIDVEAAKARRAQREEKKEEKKEEIPTRLLGIFPNQKKAFNYAAQLKKQGLVPIVEEQDDGKWAVKIPLTKEEASKQTEEKKGK